jgi:HTH-type transcriptional regulator / antitoxin HigA
MVKARRQYGFEPDYAVPPGQTLREVVESKGMSQRELADRIGLTVQSLSRILSGEQPISLETARGLELATGVPADFWNRLESQYRTQLAKVQGREAQQSEVRGWVERFAYARYADAGWVPRTRSLSEKFENLLRFFGVSGPQQWENVHLASLIQGNYRRCASVSEKAADTTAWIQRGLILAQAIPAPAYDQGRFKQALKRVRTLVQENPADVLHQVETAFAEAGVRLVMLPQLPGMGVHGYTRWIVSDRPMIIHGLRQKTNDLFWFDLFHEAAHILKHAGHGKKTPIVECEEQGSDNEQEADQWAADFLIPPHAWSQFVAGLGSRIEQAVIRSFSQAQAVHPATVVGRLHREKMLDYRIHANMKTSLKERIKEMETHPSRRKVERGRLAPLRKKLRRNVGTAPDLDKIRREMGSAHADLRR